MYQNETLNHRRSMRQRISDATTMAMLSAFATMTSAFADGSSTATIETGIKAGLKSIYDLVVSIAPALAVVGLVLVAAAIIFGGQKGMEKGKSYAITLVLVLGVILMAPVIINTVTTWFSGANGNTSSLIFG